MKKKFAINKHEGTHAKEEANRRKLFTRIVGILTFLYCEANQGLVVGWSCKLVESS